ncbi:MAG: hypothetical protein RIR26_1234 [Pseudomonadota bacterium]
MSVVAEKHIVLWQQNRVNERKNERPHAQFSSFAGIFDNHKLLFLAA